jgi:hypothetical protein
MVLATACTSIPASDLSARKTLSERVLSCGEKGSLVLLAQTVPTATMIPCVQTYLPGWVISSVPVVRSGSGSFSLSSDLAGPDAVIVRLTATCDTSGAIPQEDFGEVGTEHWFRYLHTPGAVQGIALEQYFRFPGGCVTYRYTFQVGTPGTVVDEMNSVLTFVPRAEVAQFVREEFGQTLCGAGRSCVP